MKGLLGLIRQSAPAAGSGNTPNPFLFPPAFADQGANASTPASWGARAHEVGAKRMPAGPGSKVLDELWRAGSHMARRGADAIARLERFLDFAVIPASRGLTRQNGYGSFRLVLLSGSIAMDREQPWKARLRLTKARPGDILKGYAAARQQPAFLGVLLAHRLRGSDSGRAGAR